MALGRVYLGILAALTFGPSLGANAGSQTRRVLPPESAAFVERAFERARPQLHLKKGDIDRDHVDAVVCMESPDGSCFELKLTDPENHCAGERLGPWCVTFPAGVPASAPLGTLRQALSADQDVSPWVEVRAEDEPPLPDRQDQPSSSRDMIELLGRYLDILARNWPGMLLAAFLTLLAGYLWHRQTRWRSWLTPGITRRFQQAFLIIFMGAGLLLVWKHASLVDDAYISFRYARNWVEGHGLVYISGERVEGYTNFLWTVLIALGMFLTPLDAPQIALILGPICFLANIWVVYRIGSALAEQYQPSIYIPAAAALLSVQVVFAAFGTSGMETMLASLFVDLGLLFLISRKDILGSVLAGGMFILGTLTRPDHSLFYIAGGIALLAREVSRTRSLKQRIGMLGAYASPLIIYLPYLAWKISYYGSILPNTYYAKSVDQWYVSQGMIYLVSFFLGSHFWILIIFVTVWLLTRGAGTKTNTLKVFSLTAFVLYNIYIVKIGGDFMYGRFYVPLIPIILLCAEDLLYLLNRKTGIHTRWRRLRTLVPASLLAVTVHGSQFIEDWEGKWNLTFESSYGQVSLSRFGRLEQNRMGILIKNVFVDRGIIPVLATGTIGELGYYSRLPVVIDTMGLTDANIASTSLLGRSRPGHEKQATADYLKKRGVHFIPMPLDVLSEQSRPALTTMKIETGQKQPTFWYIFKYDRQLMQTIHEKCPEVHFVDFETYLDEYLNTIQHKSRQTVENDFRWFREYYFDHNQDPHRRLRFEEYLQEEK